MGKKGFFGVLWAAVLVAWIPQTLGQSIHGNVLYRARNVHSGNQIRTSWWNFGMLGNRRGDLSLTYGGEWPINSGQVQLGNSAFFVASEIPVYDPERSAAAGDSVLTDITPVIFCEGWDPDRFSHDSIGTFLGFEPLPGFYNMDNEDENKAAMSHQAITWPAYWPDKLSDAVHPGWRGAWNGYFGYNVTQADQESFTMVDDYNFHKQINGLYPPPPRASEPDRFGLGLKTSFRGLQWSNPDAEDCIFWILEIENIGELELYKTVFGMDVGASMGALLTQHTDWMDDCARFYREIALTVNYDYDNIGTAGYTPVPWMGYAFLESPGNPFDGIDNDGDGSAASGGGHIIAQTDFLVKFINIGDPVVTIDYKSENYTRTVTTMPPEGITITYHNTSRTIMPNTPVDELPRNGIDDNLNGIIDESDGAEITETGEVYYLYLRDDVYNKRDYLAKDWITGEGLTNLMIDERRDDGIDNDGDWDPMNDDVGLDGAEGTGDTGEGDGIPTPGQGELPGEPHIDRVDVKEADQIGLTAFTFYEYATVVKSNDDQIWFMSRPGYFDGHLENVDADYIYSSGYFPLLPGKKESFSVGLIYGEDESDILRNKETVQQIYNANYNFAVAPKLPTLWVVPGDRKVTLYWDDIAEESKDRFLNEYDFEGYKVYRATDPGFVDAGVITDGYGYTKYKKPLAVYDKIDGVSGFFSNTFGTGVQFYLGSETGLAHTYVDSPLTNGRRYYYAVTAFDRGNLEKSISPSETSKYVTIDASGNVQTGQNVGYATPSAPSLGYIPPEFTGQPEYVSGTYIGNGVLRTRFIDPEDETDGRRYRIEFLDTATDSIDNDRDWNEATDDVDGDGTASKGDLNVDENDIDEFVPSTTGLRILDITNLSSPSVVGTIPFFESRMVDSQWVEIKNLYMDDDKNASTVRTSFEGIEYYLYNPEPAILTQITETDTIIDGIAWSASVNRLHSYDLVFELWGESGYVPGTFYPRQYKIVFYDDLVDTSWTYNLVKNDGKIRKIRSTQTNFRVLDGLTEEPAPFAFRENFTSAEVPAGFYSGKDEIWFFENLPDGSRLMTFYLLNNTLYDTSFTHWYGRSLSAGDTLYLYTEGPFSARDRFEFGIHGEKVDQQAAKNSLNLIKVVPNPYVVTAAWEHENPYTSGHGPREIRFIHLPSRCTIRIYAMDGTLVRTLEHESELTEGSQSWDLLTKDQMDVAYGMYIYHVDAPGIGEKVGKLILIK